jgi:1-acyl-sn-glycerol-3-phosphate acyltransferase
VDGLLRPFRKGPAILAVESRSIIVPAAVIGAHEVWARGSSRIRIRPLEVRFGEPISPTDESYETLTARAHGAVADLLKAAEPP